MTSRVLDWPGARWTGAATTFAVRSGHATALDLCLIETDNRSDGSTWRHERRLSMSRAGGRHGDLWSTTVPGVGPGQRYGYRAYGPWSPADGLLFNPAKLLVDPYATRIENGSLDERGLRSGVMHPGEEFERPDPTDSLQEAPLGVVSALPSAQRSQHPRVAWEDTVIYEAHVGGMTMLHPDVEPALRGKFLGLTSAAVAEHLCELGVTSVELLPVHHSLTEPFLHHRGLTNYWGYSTLGFFAPDTRFAIGDPLTEFAAMVEALHAAGLEVILDVVFNHTAEGGPGGPTVCWRGLDNAGYYRLDPTDRSRYIDVTGTGNTLDTTSPIALSMVADSLRFWVDVYGVDGFRFDLASALIRDRECNVDPHHPLLAVLAQDPVLSQVKLIAEPWDVGLGGYRVGGFPKGWSEWNGAYRDTVRDYWRSEPRQLPAFASRVAGSADIYEATGRRPSASINFVTSHDGFTLADLVSYNQAHNEANGEANADGERHNRSWNSGAEGPTDDATVQLTRARRQRSLLATLAVSRGVPMLVAGDELGRTQGGNNNAYCQDNVTAWIDWDRADTGLLDFARRAMALRREYLVLRRDRFFKGLIITDDTPGPDDADISWFGPDGTPLVDGAWLDENRRQLVAVMTPELAVRPEPDGRGAEPPPVSSRFHVLIATNASADEMRVDTDALGLAGTWTILLDSDPLADDRPQAVDGTFVVAPWCLLVAEGPHPKRRRRAATTRRQAR